MLWDGLAAYSRPNHETTGEDSIRRALITLGVVVLAAFAFASTAGALDAPQVLRFVDVEESFTPIDEFPDFEEAWPPLGARSAFRDGLYAWAGSKRGNRVGKIEGFCTFIRVSIAQRSATQYCTAEAKVRGGTILLAGFITFSEAQEESFQFIVPVIGGTGRFDNARGTLTIRDLRSGSSAAVFRLTP